MSTSQRKVPNSRKGKDDLFQAIDLYEGGSLSPIGSDSSQEQA